MDESWDELLKKKFSRHTDDFFWVFFEWWAWIELSSCPALKFILYTRMSTVGNTWKMSMSRKFNELLQHYVSIHFVTTFILLNQWFQVLNILTFFRFSRYFKFWKKFVLKIFYYDFIYFQPNLKNNVWTSKLNKKTVQKILLSNCHSDKIFDAIYFPFLTYKSPYANKTFTTSSRAEMREKKNKFLQLPTQNWIFVFSCCLTPPTKISPTWYKQSIVAQYMTEDGRATTKYK